ISTDAVQRYGSVGELEADLVRALEDAAALRAQETVSTPAPGGKFITWQRSAIAAILAVIGALAAFFWTTFNGSPPRTSVPGVIHSVAVLPLVNLSGDPSQEYFADGMTEELIARLGRLPGLAVISRTSIMTFKRSSRSLPEIARTLGVDAVLEGSVLVLPAAPAATKRVRINARLIAAGTDTQLWDRTFETVVDDVLALQSQVAKAVVDGIHLRLSRQQQGVLARAGGDNGQPQDFEAFDLYLRGRYYWNLRTTDGLNRSVEYFQKAIDRDPGYASAYAGLADAYVLLGALGTMPYGESLARASTAATKAIALDESLAEAHASLGLVQHNRLEWDAAEGSFKRALDLNPGYARAYHWRAAHLAQRGRFADATSAIQKALELDPLSASVHTQAAAVLFLSRRYDETIERAQKALQLDPTFVRAQLFVAEAYAQKREDARALETIEKAATIRGRTAELQAFLGCALAMADRQPEAQKTADELIDRYRKTQEGGPVGIALVYSCLRDNDRAFDWLERARSLRDPWLGYLTVDPFFDNLRTDPRYAPLLAALGVTQ
ncbi:MAG: tetratricopeptide repeat protein, partial [Acidobacteria bacterium]|nr:tetratricopeptide repeat protein [Acidobacteriota bacterium]MCA1583589.1 tetratricopeptide repeat protein [Acidobacteriota bacterium]